MKLFFLLYISIFLFLQIFGSQACQVFQRHIITEDPDYSVSENEAAALQQRALC